MLKIGITGGIGSGKSLICHIFGTFGIPTYEADSRAKWLMKHDPNIKQAIITHFGENSYLPDGDLNRPHIAQQVFQDESKNQLINSIVHPKVGEDYQAWVVQNSQYPYLLNEAALMFEAGRNIFLDKIITVFAPLAIRIKRIQARDSHRSEVEIRGIIAKQMPEEDKVAKSDFVIYNDDKTPVLQQVLALHEQFLRNNN